MNIEQAQEILTERIKELTCLYEVSKTIRKSDCVEKKTLKQIILSTKKAWKFNEDAIVEIQIKNHALSTSKIPKNTVFQNSNIAVPESTIGFIKVHYPAQKYTSKHFLKEEQKLLDTIAVEIENYITKFHILEKKAALRRTIERINRLSLLGEMTAGIAHELNNPLANILGYAELIKLSNTDEEIDSDITTIINSIIYTRQIVKKMQLFSIEAPRQVQIEKIKPIVSFALSFLKPNFQKKEIKSELLFKNEMLTANIDSVQLTQILFNLLINAIHASPNNSTIRTIIENDDTNLFIIIEDQGHGITEDIKEKIFESFFTTKNSNMGSGLGLSVVKGIVENYNGEISIKNNTPTGTIFKVRLPLK